MKDAAVSTIDSNQPFNSILSAYEQMRAESLQLNNRKTIKIKKKIEEPSSRECIDV